MEPFIEARPLCDPLLVQVSTESSGYTAPLYLAPSIYYSQHGDIPSLYRQIDRYTEPSLAVRLKGAIDGLFSTPGVVTTYWKPRKKGRPFRIDVLANLLGHTEAWVNHTRNKFIPVNFSAQPRKPW